ncbi:MAG TPA: hypothetical protein VE913_08065 [Longimicrobium sp.]|nr:hypothetical protein [Longimicrobium sp.]
MPPTRYSRRWLAATVVLAAACGDQSPVSPEQVGVDLPARAVQAFDCQANLRSGTVSCGVPASGASRAIIGGQNDYVRLTSSNVTSAGGLFEFDVTVQNLLPEGLGTPDGVLVDTAGINVVFVSGPTVTAGTGNVSVDNEDGTQVLVGTEPQAYFRYPQKLVQNEVSAAKRWRIAYDPGVQSFGFSLLVVTEVQPLLVLNELLANPGGTISDANGEWFEVYNAGRLPVQMQGMLIADSAASGRRPFHVVASSLLVPSGGYVVLGNTTNTTNNGGVPVDYAYGAAFAFANSLDALKISRSYGASDTLTINRTQYASAAISAQNGVSRELKNPALDNSNMDGSNWADALVTAVYGPGGRGTPKAQNSTYTP